MLLSLPARTIARWIAFPSLALFLTSCGGSNSHQHFSEMATPEPESTAGHHIKNVFLIAMENHNWAGDGFLSIKGNTEAPYINKTLVPIGAHPSRYYNPPNLHPSLPNYLWLESWRRTYSCPDRSALREKGLHELHVLQPRLDAADHSGDLRRGSAASQCGE